MSNLIINLNKVADSIKTAELLMDKIKTDSKAAINPQEYIKENRLKTVKQVKGNLQELNTERKIILLNEVVKHKKRLDEYTKKQKPDNAVLQFLRAERIINAKSAAEAIGVYSRQLDRMSEDERSKARYIYDDSLLEYVARYEPEALFMAEEAIDQYRGDVEKNYIQGLNIAHEINENSKIIDAAIEQQIKALAEGEKPANYNMAQIVNEITENARYAVRGSEVNTLRVNPYEDMPENENTEPAESEIV